MSNVKHPKCAIRSLASQARARLVSNAYSLPAAPRTATPQQQEIYLKLCEYRAQGVAILNPIQQFADEKKLQTLSHDERQRYILQISADYISMRNLLDERSRGGKAC